jgi:hypothetical protein
MIRSGVFVVLRAVFIFLGVAACDKAAPPTATTGSGAVAAGSQAAAPAAGSQAVAPPAPGSQAAAPPAAGSQAAAPEAGSQAAATPPAAPSAPPAENPLHVGAAVDGRWTDGRWYPGKIGAINADGTFRVNYNDGDVSRSLPAAKVRLRHAGATHHSGGGGGGGSCGGGLTQCGGRCVDIHNDNRNCNACGRQCPEACMGGSCVSNHYKYGN